MDRVLAVLFQESGVMTACRRGDHVSFPTLEVVWATSDGKCHPGIPNNRPEAVRNVSPEDNQRVIP
jgi:hypothetical protein